MWLRLSWSGAVGVMMPTLTGRDERAGVRRIKIGMECMCMRCLRRVRARCLRGRGRGCSLWRSLRLYLLRRFGSLWRGAVGSIRNRGRGNISSSSTIIVKSSGIRKASILRSLTRFRLLHLQKHITSPLPARLLLPSSPPPPPPPRPPPRLLPLPLPVLILLPLLFNSPLAVSVAAAAPGWRPRSVFLPSPLLPPSLPP